MISQMSPLCVTLLPSARPTADQLPSAAFVTPVPDDTVARADPLRLVAMLVVAVRVVTIRKEPVSVLADPCVVKTRELFADDSYNKLSVNHHAV